MAQMTEEQKKESLRNWVGGICLVIILICFACGWYMDYAKQQAARNVTPAPTETFPQKLFYACIYQADKVLKLDSSAAQDYLPAQWEAVPGETDTYYVHVGYPSKKVTVYCTIKVVPEGYMFLSIDWK